EGGGVVGVNLIEIPVHDPGDAAGGPIGTHGHRAGQVAEVVDGGLRSRAQRAVGIYDVGVGPTAIAANPIDLAVEESGGAERTAQLHRRRVVAAAVGHGIENMIVIGIEMSQVVAVDQIDLAFLAAGDHQVWMTGDAGRIGQQHRRAGAEIRVGIVQGRNVVGNEIVCHLQSPTVRVLVGGSGSRSGHGVGQSSGVVGVGREAV